MRRFISLLLFLGVFAGLHASELTVFAAASLADALKEIARSYETTSGDRLRFNFGGSSTLALQIRNGAPADIFFSADEAKMDDLAKAGLIAAATRCSLLSNTLVIVVSSDRSASVSRPADLANDGVRRVALAEPRTVPAGIYAKQYLQQIGLWGKLSDKVIPTENVRACLAAVEAGNVDAGVVYKTDALISKKVKIAYEIAVNEGPKISYSLAVVRDAKAAGPARKFVAYLKSDEAQAVFARYGFLPAR